MPHMALGQSPGSARLTVPHLTPLNLRRVGAKQDVDLEALVKNTILAAVGFAILLAARGVPAADPDRGRELYESRCGECHSESVHGRAKRVAADFADVRGWVSRWNKNLALRWGDAEIDDVSVYLNNTYYRYPCPREVCKVVSLR